MNKLTNVQPYEVSLVPKGANKKSFNIFKSADYGKANINKMLDLNNLDLKMAESIINAYNSLSPFRDNIPDEVFEELINALGLSFIDDKQQMDEYMVGIQQACNKRKKEENQGGNKTMSNVDLKLFKGFSEDEIKDLPENILTKLETVFKTNEGIVEKSAQLEKQLKEKEEKEKMQSFITKAETEFDKLPIKKEELASILKSISEKDAENYSKLENFLKSTNTMLKENYLFKEIGSSASTESSGTAWGRAEAMAKGIIQKDSNMSIEKAISKVFEEHQDLYKEYLEGK